VLFLAAAVHLEAVALDGGGHARPRLYAPGGDSRSKEAAPQLLDNGDRPAPGTTTFPAFSREEGEDFQKARHQKLPTKRIING